MSDFDQAFDFLMDLEGGGWLHNVPGDPGGDTIYGIARNRNPHMWTHGVPTEAAARQFYWEGYWLPLRLDQVQPHSIAEEVFEFAVHAGHAPATRAAQIAVNAVFACVGRAPITVDGHLGPRTVAALNQIPGLGPTALLAWDGAFNLQQLNYYRTLRPALVDQFLRGWTRRVVR